MIIPSLPCRNGLEVIKASDITGPFPHRSDGIINSGTEAKGLTYIEPFSDTQVSVHDLPVLTTSDISGIRLTTNPHEANFETIFTFYLAPKNVGEQGIPMQRGTGLVVVVNGSVVATPTLLSPIENEFYLTGFDSAEAIGLFRELTTGSTNSNLTADPSEASVER